MSNKDDATLRGVVPKLLSDGANWVIFKIHLTMSITALDALGHLDGSDPKPTEPRISSQDITLWTDDDQTKNETYQTELKKWSNIENITRAHIATQIPGSLLMQVYNVDTVTNMWKTICDEYKGKT